MLKQLSSRAVTVKAVHYYSNSDIHPCGEVKSTDIPKDDRDAGGLPGSLTVSTETRIMLIQNIYASNGLVSGTMGYVDSFDLAVDGLVFCKTSVKFDDADTGRVFQDSSNAISIE